MSIIWCFDSIENKPNVYRREDWMKQFCESLWQHVVKIINFAKKKMIPLTNEQQELHVKGKICYISKKKFESKYTTDTTYRKVRDHCHFTGKYRSTEHRISYSKYSTPKEIPVIFYNGSNYDYYFVVKEVANELEEEFNCLGQNTEKYRTFSVNLPFVPTGVRKRIS